MPRFFFDVVDGNAITDEVGTDLANTHAMRQESLRFVAMLLAEEEIRRDLGLHWALVVRDESGSHVLKLTIQN